MNYGCLIIVAFKINSTAISNELEVCRSKLESRHTYKFLLNFFLSSATQIFAYFLC